MRVKELCCKLGLGSREAHVVSSGGTGDERFQGPILWLRGDPVGRSLVLSYDISYRDVEQMLAERGVEVDHTTTYGWVQAYAPETEMRLRWQWRCPRSGSWRVDETYVKVGGRWRYLYRALDKQGNTIDFYLSPTRSAAAAKRFLGKALRG